jgi:hypothetical protein
MKYLGTDNKAGNAACILFIFIYIIFFQVSGTSIIGAQAKVDSYAVPRRSGVHLGSRSLPNTYPSKGFELRFVLYVHRGYYFHSTFGIGIQEPVSGSLL